MSVEETQQPSYTVMATADGLPLHLAIPQPSAETFPLSSSPSTFESLANRWEPEVDVTERQEHDVVANDQSESLQQWVNFQQRGPVSRDEQRPLEFDPARDPWDEEDMVDGNDSKAQNLEGDPFQNLEGDPSGNDPSSASDVQTPDAACKNGALDSEPENIPSPPVSTPPPAAPTTDKGPTSFSERSRNAKTSPTVVQHSRTPLHPMNHFSPHKTHQLATTASSKPKSTSNRQAISAHRAKEPEDSFAEDNINRHILPYTRFDRLLQQGKSEPAGSHQEPMEEEKVDTVPSWNNSAMKAFDTSTDPSVKDTNASDQTSDLQQLPTPHGDAPIAAITANQNGPGDPSQASDSVPVDHTSPRSSIVTPTKEHIELPVSSRVQQKRFAGMLESQSSQGLPGDVPFSQHEDVESQHSVHSMSYVATQSYPRQPQPYLSSPPAEPTPVTHSHSTGPRSVGTVGTEETNSSLVPSHPTMKTHGATQEPTQLVTDDELAHLPKASSPAAIGSKRVLPSARALRAGRGIVSQPTNRSRMVPEVPGGPNTIAAPQAAQASSRPTAGPPQALEPTQLDTIQDLPEAHESVTPAQSPAPMISSPPLPEEDAVGDNAGRPAEIAMEPTYVDPTITSLPAPQPHRPTPRKYGKQHTVKSSSPPSPTVRALATPPPSAGPSGAALDIAQDRPKSPPNDDVNGLDEVQPATKARRIPKRKRRDSSASISASSSSSEELDPLDESYRPASKASSKAKSRSKAINPNLKRVKRSSRGRSSSRQTSVTASHHGNMSPPLTPAPPSPDAVEPPIILASWKADWYLGRVTGTNKDGYLVKFEDGDASVRSLDQIRQGWLKKGENVRWLGGTSVEHVVAEDWQGDRKGVKVSGGGRIPLDRLCVRKAVVKSDFDDRQVIARDLGFDSVTPAPTTTKAPHRPSIGPSRPVSSASSVFTGKLFFITLAKTKESRGNVSKQTSLRVLIERHGGKLVEDWTDLFDLPASGFGSTLASTSAPFLLLDAQESALTPKVLVSLAKGIPCLSVAFIEDAILDPTVDWRCYLTESGFSDRLQQHCSQVVSSTWGSIGWNAATAQAERRPFNGKTFLFLEIKQQSKKSIQSLALVCLHAMGAAHVEVSRSLASQQDLARYDYVLVEDRDSQRALPKWFDDVENVCNVLWLKQCLVMGAAIPPIMWPK